MLAKKINNNFLLMHDSIRRQIWSYMHACISEDSEKSFIVGVVLICCGAGVCP